MTRPTYAEMAAKRWPLSPIERFLSYVRVGETPDDCWIWTGTQTGRGYGTFSVRKHFQAAHRWSYEHYIGPIPDGMDLCHTCDVRLCVNVAHLFVGTRADNMADAACKGRTTQGERSPLSKLTRADVLVILSVPRKRGVPVVLAQQFGVSASLIRMIWAGKRWAWNR